MTAGYCGRNTDMFCGMSVYAGGVLVKTSAQLDAKWSSVNDGIVNFSKFGWIFQDLQHSRPAAFATLATNRSGGDWSYTFTATGNGKIELNYNVGISIGNPLNLRGWDIDWSGTEGGQNLTPFSSIDPTTSGQFIRPIESGQTYTIGLQNHADIYFDEVPPLHEGFMYGSFDWHISAVPEPDVWVLMILGFGGVGAMVRLRRRLISIPALI